MFNATELKVELTRQRWSRVKLCEATGIPYSTMTKHMKDGNFSAPQMKAIKDVLELSNDRFMEIFYSDVTD